MYILIMSFYYILFCNTFTVFVCLFDISIGLLGQVEGPVADVEERKDGGENNAGKNVDLLGPAGELVEPGHQEVAALARLHVYLALVDVVVCDGVPGGTNTLPVASTSHLFLQK